MQYRSDFTESSQPKKMVRQQKSPKNYKIRNEPSQGKNRYLKNQGFKFNMAASHSFRSKNVRRQQVAAEDAKAKRIA